MNERDDDNLVQDARRLKTEITPSRDLWPGIEAAIRAGDPASSPRRMLWLAQAAGVLILVAASSLLTYTLTKTDDLVSPVVPVAGLNIVPASFGNDYQLQAEYTLARNNLEARLDDGLDRLSPEARTDVEENLEVIRSAIREINAALEREPDNVLLQDLLLSTYREELAVMRKVGGLTRSVMSRNDI